MTRPGWPDLALCAALVLIALATLTPGAPGSAPEFSWAPNPADLLLNFALFVPLGLALRWARRPPRTALAAGTLTSAVVELSQLWLIPGRDASPWDLLANALGSWAPSVLSPLLVTLPLALAWLASGWLLSPAPPGTRVWWGQWAHRFPATLPFQGVVHRVELNGRAIPDASLSPEATDSLRASFHGQPITLVVDLMLPEAPVPGLAQIASVADGDGGEVLGLWQHRGTLVTRWAARGNGIGLRPPAVAVADLPQPVSGTPGVLTMTVGAGRLVASIGGGGSHRLWLGPWEGWRLLWPLAPLRAPAAWLLSLAWTLACLGPSVYLVLARARRRPS